jgi:LPXTG-motif cell wall-anchored protein
MVDFTSGGVTLGTATTDSGGTADITLHAPTKAGTFIVTATSSGACVASASVAMSVLTQGLPLPRTGSDTTVGGLLVGGVAVGAGAALIGLAAFRRRRLLAA